MKTFSELFVNKTSISSKVKLDEKSLREMYINEEIFNIGDYVKESINNEVGRIIRRGTNYLICVTEDNKMFKTWLQDAVNFTKISGVPAHKREVGTDSHREYVMRLMGVKEIKNFINKNKKS